MISKIVVLIEEQVRCRVTEEVAEQLQQMASLNALGKGLNHSMLTKSEVTTMPLTGSTAKNQY